ncbi:MAG: sodium/glutamate symporter [Verrucomicrobiota bacterium]
MTEDGTIPTFKLDLIQTLAVAAVVFYAGVRLRRAVKVLDALNIPSAVVGGLMFAGLMLAGRDRWINIQFDTAMQPLLMVAFFTTIGMGASLALLKRGGLQVLIFLLVSSVFCFVQNGIGMAVAGLLGINLLVGVIAGSVTLVGGPATGIAFAPLFEKAGVAGADVLAITAATFGIVWGGITGGPVGTFLIRRHKLRPAPTSGLPAQPELDGRMLTVDPEREDSDLVMNLLVLGVAMGLGSILSGYFESLGWTLPAYIGAMIVASVFRNIDDRTGLFRVDARAMEFVGTVSLNTFLVVALMNLKLWELFHLAGPLFVILVIQVIAVVLAAATFVHWIMGRDFDSAVMASGFIGFVLGTTANAIANMKTLTARFGPAPKAFLVVPMVGAFFIDFVNAIIINLFLNWLQ